MSIKMRIAVTLLALSNVIGAAQAKDVDIPVATRSPQLDGVFSPAEWTGAATVDQLTQVRPREGVEPTFQTRFHLMRDADFLYVAIDAQDTDPASIAAHQLIQGQSFPTDDRVWIMLDPSGSRQQGYLFQVNANGVRRDALLDNLDTFNDDWDGIWDAHARIDEAGWKVEIAIPWRTLPFNFRRSHLGINFGRMLVRKGEYALWSSEGGQDKPAYWGRAPMPGDIDNAIGLTLVPSFVLRSPSSADESAMQPTLDAKYRIGTNWQAIASLNTDFSGTGLDNREVNLTRFPLFLPEKRYLFVQDADAFSFSHLTRHGNPFFSRRIALAADGTPLDMQGGLKVVGRGETYTIGALGVRQALPNDGNTQVGVMRAKWDPNASVSVGGIATWGNPDTGNDDRLVGADARLHVPGLWGRFIGSLTAFAMRSLPEQGVEDTAHGAGFKLVAPNAWVTGSWGSYGRHSCFPWVSRVTRADRTGSLRSPTRSTSTRRECDRSLSNRTPTAWKTRMADWSRRRRD